MKLIYPLLGFFIFGISLCHGEESTPVCLHGRQECAFINQWYLEGTAAGNSGDVYDNRDRGHSFLDVMKFPQLGLTEYSRAERHAKRDMGGQTKIFKNVTIGNSSTSAEVTRTGSNVRTMYYCWDFGMNFLYLQYRSSNVHIYPEHRDHDPGHNGRPGFGDLFPTNSPYVVISQGSSGSDRPFLYAFAHTLAAFRPEVKAKLISQGLLMPTLQMIFRMSNKSADDYLSGKAHPTAFEPRNIDTVKMVKMAHDITLETLPPFVQITVVEEDPTPQDLEYFKIDKPEALCDTPCVIARIVRRPAYKQRIVVSAEKSFDVNGKDLQFHWVVLRGNAENITINTLQNGLEAEILVPYHPRQPIAPEADLASNRVDIGVFAHNGSYFSAPAFVTFFTLDNEMRTYDDQKRLIEIWYDARDQGVEVKDWNLLLQAFKADTPSWVSSFLPQDSGKEHILQALNTIKDDTSFYIDHAAFLEDIIDHCAPQQKAQFLAVRDHLLALKLLTKTDKGYVITPQQNSLTSYERYQLARLNLAILAHLLYPQSLRYWETRNFVDPRLTTVKSQRNVFHYSKQS